MHRMTIARRAALALPLLAMPALGRGQGLPSRPVRILVPFPPGGPTDFAARLVAEGMQAALGQPVVVENRPGGAGNIAAEQAVRAAPDGTTMLFSGSGLGINAALFRNLPFDTARDLAPVVLVSSSPNLLSAGPRLQVAGIAGLIEEAKRRPGEVTVAVGSLGTTQHLAVELLKMLAGIDVTIVPYRGAALAMNDLLAGTVDALSDGITSSLPQVRQGRIRALGVTSAERSPAAPDIPAVAETLPGFDAVAWFGLHVPAATPAEAVGALNRAANAALAREEVRARFAESGARVLGGTPGEARAHLAAEITRWAEVVRRTGAKAE
jgi:tripartite-type tricarboxylate transporter receptor subunit TctC